MSRDELSTELRVLATEAVVIIRNRDPDLQHKIREVYRKFYHEDIISLPSHIRLTALLRRSQVIDDEIRRVCPECTTDEAKERASWTIIDRLLSPYLLRAIQEDRTLDEQAIAVMINDACLYLIDNKHNVRVCYFLKGTSIKESLQIEDINIRQISQAELDHLERELPSWMGDFHSFLLINHDVAVIDQCVLCSPAEVVDSIASQERIAEILIQFLRIHASSSIVAICATREMGSLWQKSVVPFVRVALSAGLDAVDLPNDIITARWSQNKQILLNPPPALGVALRRFEMLKDSQNTDRILDQAIILEALFSDDTKQEIAHKLSLRIANFVGLDFADRRELFPKIKKAYDARSSIAHGGKPSKNSTEIDKLISKVVQDALIRYIAYAQHFGLRDKNGEKQLVVKLDEMCIGGPPVFPLA